MDSKITVTAPVEISAETLAYVIEGADFGYWGCYDEYVEAADILAGKGVAVICERDDEGGEPILSSAMSFGLEDIRCALVTMAREYPRHFADIVTGNFDSITGDVLVQLAVLADIKYG